MNGFIFLLKDVTSRRPKVRRFWSHLWLFTVALWSTVWYALLRFIGQQYNMLLHGSVLNSMAYWIIVHCSLWILACYVMAHWSRWLLTCNAMPWVVVHFHWPLRLMVSPPHSFIKNFYRCFMTVLKIFPDIIMRKIMRNCVWPTTWAVFTSFISQNIL